MKIKESFLSARMLLVILAIAGIGVFELFVTHAESVSTISGTSFRDINRNGIQDTGEEPIANHYIYFYDSAGAYLGNALTDASGNYQKTGLSDGNYTILYAPISYNELKQDWVPTTTESLKPQMTITLSGSARVNFGWRKIVRSTDTAAPISTYTGSNGLLVKSYDDVVTAQQVYIRLMTGTLVGQETKNIIIRFDIGTGQTSSFGVNSNGTYVDYRATSNVSWLGWLRDDAELFHEYGHAWSGYYAYLAQQDPGLTGYQKARGIYGDARVNTSYNWNVGEMIAEDYRQLFGPSTAQTGSQINYELPLAKDVPGLKEYLSGAFLSFSSDTTPPAAPTNLTGKPATQNEASEIDLSWTASTDNVSVSKYLIYRDNVQVGFVNSPSTSFADVSLSVGTAYQYYVKAVDAAGNTSANSNTITVTTLSSDITAPSAPSSLTSPTQTTNSISLSWHASTDNIGVTGYRVYQIGGNRKNTYTNLIGTNTTTNYMVTNLSKGTSYSFYVVAIDGAGNESIPSNTLTVKTKR